MGSGGECARWVFPILVNIRRTGGGADIQVGFFGDGQVPILTGEWGTIRIGKEGEMYKRYGKS